MSLVAFIGVAGFILDAAGKIIVAHTAIAVHYRFWKQHEVDEKVFEQMKAERHNAIVGVGLMVLGTVAQLPQRLGL